MSTLGQGFAVSTRRDADAVQPCDIRNDVPPFPAAVAPGRGPTPLSVKDNNVVMLEAEFAFRLVKDIAPSKEHTLETVKPCVGELLPAIEVVAARQTFEGIAIPSLVADLAGGFALVCGEPIPHDKWKKCALPLPPLCPALPLPYPCPALPTSHPPLPRPLK
eukprot:gene6331-6139_t